jgi:hypothetical protein
VNIWRAVETTRVAGDHTQVSVFIGRFFTATVAVVGVHDYDGSVFVYLEWHEKLEHGAMGINKDAHHAVLGDELSFGRPI